MIKQTSPRNKEAGHGGNTPVSFCVLQFGHLNGILKALDVSCNSRLEKLPVGDLMGNRSLSACARERAMASECVCMLTCKRMHACVCVCVCYQKSRRREVYTACPT